jgi:hypothetical protein
MKKTSHLLDANDLKRIASAVEWPMDSLEHQVRYIEAVNILYDRMWGNHEPIRLWNSIPPALRNTLGYAFEGSINTLKKLCETWVKVAFSLEETLGKAHPTELY